MRGIIPYLKLQVKTYLNAKTLRRKERKEIFLCLDLGPMYVIYRITIFPRWSASSIIASEARQSYRTNAGDCFITSLFAMTT